ncbi:MAG: hypothetical protein JW817_02270 [Clostridiales bacterium]|nr:hypothetical protein [Clostridiales bacterium]
MKKVVFAAVLIFISVFVLFADQRATTSDGRTALLKDDGTWEWIERTGNISEGFRGAIWGMSKEQVKDTESLSLLQEMDEVLMYQGSIAGLSCYIGYIFSGDVLVRGKYLITQQHSNKTDFITDYGNLKSLLAKKYSEPIVDDIVWKNNLYKSDREEWGMAIAVGHLVYFSTWKTDATDINLTLFGDNYSITFAIEYVGRDVAVIEQSNREQKALDDL